MYDLYPCRTLREYAAHMKHTKTRMEHAMWRIDYVLILILIFFMVGNARDTCGHAV